MLHLALMKLGFDQAAIDALPEAVAMAYLAAHREATNPPKKKCKVLRKNNG